MVMDASALRIKSFIWNNVRYELLILKPVLNFSFVEARRRIFALLNSKWILIFLIICLNSTYLSNIVVDADIIIIWIIIFWECISIVCIISYILTLPSPKTGLCAIQMDLYVIYANIFLNFFVVGDINLKV